MRRKRKKKKTKKAREEKEDKAGDDITMYNRHCWINYFKDQYIYLGPSLKINKSLTLSKSTQ